MAAFHEKCKKWAAALEPKPSTDEGAKQAHNEFLETKQVEIRKITGEIEKMNDWFHSMEDKVDAEIKAQANKPAPAKPAAPVKPASPAKEPVVPAKKEEEPIVAPNRRQSSIDQARVQMQLKAEAEQKAREVAMQKKIKKDKMENEGLSKDLQKMEEDEKLLQGLDQLEKKEKE